MVAAGLVGLGYCVLAGYRVRRAGLDEAEFRKRLQRLVAINLASVAGAGLGLALLVVGLAL